MFLEIGFSRAEERRHGGRQDPRQLLDRDARLVGGRLRARLRRAGGEISGTMASSSTSAHRSKKPARSIPFVETYSISPAALMLFRLAFCAVSLAIVWGTTLERIKFGAYVIYAVVFGAVIYPLIAHAVCGGGLLSDIGGKPVMDFAGSSVVHLTGAIGALGGAAAARPARGQVRRRRQAAGDPGALDAAGRPRRDHPLDRLVRLQRGLDLRNRRLVLRRGVARTPSSPRPPV